MSALGSEQSRIAALHSYRILDTPADPRFDEIVALASEICGTSMAAITLIDETRGWFKAAVGLGVPEVSRDDAFCSTVVSTGELLVLDDAARDSRFACNPLVVGGLVRFYAGAPIISRDGYVLGSVCALDPQARQLAPHQRASLRLLSKLVLSQLELHRHLQNVISVNEMLDRRVAEQTVGLRDEITARADAERRMRALSVHLVALREEEQTAMARKVHDELGQLLTAMRIDLMRLASIPSMNEQAHQERVAELLAFSDHALATVRTIAADLRPAVLDELGLLAAVENELERFRERTGTEVTLSTEPERIDAPPEHATALFRILQEGLTNIVRHAGARKVSVHLQDAGGSLALELCDDGIGIPAAVAQRSSSLGLIGISERARALGGSMEVGPRGRDGGTRLRVVVPVRESPPP